MAEAAKHTPGPWFVDGPADNQIVWSDSDNRICFLAHSNGASVAQDFANGRLIAAAPDLLAALKLHIEYEAIPADRGGRIGPKGQAWSAYLRARDAAVALAEGKKGS